MDKYSYDRRSSGPPYDTRMKPGHWYTQTFKTASQIWFLAQKELKNGGYAGKEVRWETRRPKAINASVPKAYWDLWKEVSENEVPPEVRSAV